MYVCALYMCNAPGDQERVTDLLALGLQRVVSHQVGAGNLSRSSGRTAGALPY